MNWKIGIDTYTLIDTVYYIDNEKRLYNSENSIQCSVVTQTGRKSKKRGGMYTYSRFTLLYSRK